MQTRTVLGVDTCTYLPVERRNAPPLRLHRLQAGIRNSLRELWNLYSEPFDGTLFIYCTPSEAPQLCTLHRDSKVHLRVKRKGTDCAPERRRHRVATRGGWTSTLSTITRGVRHHVHTLDDHPGGWHTNREGGRSVLVSHLAISCRDPKQFARTLESIF